MYGDNFQRNPRAKKAYDKLTFMYKNTIDFHAFSVFAKKHPVMLYPAFTLQSTLKKYIIGNSFWKKQAANRLQLSDGKYRNVMDIIKNG
jgi:hypothetical protein